MSSKHKDSETPTAALKNEAARQRWDLFHRAIEYAKQSNDAALDDADDGQRRANEGEGRGPLLSIVR